MELELSEDFKTEIRRHGVMVDVLLSRGGSCPGCGRSFARVGPALTCGAFPCVRAWARAEEMAVAFEELGDAIRGFVQRFPAWQERERTKGRLAALVGKPERRGGIANEYIAGRLLGIDPEPGPDGLRPCFFHGCAQRESAPGALLCDDHFWEVEQARTKALAARICAVDYCARRALNGPECERHAADERRGAS